MGSIIPSMVKAARIAVAIKEKMTLAMVPSWEAAAVRPTLSMGWEQMGSIRARQLDQDAEYPNQ